MKRNKIIGLLAIILIIGGLISVSYFGYIRIRYVERNDTVIESVSSTDPSIKEKAIKKVEKEYKVKPIGIIQIPEIKVNNGIVAGQSMTDMFYGVGWNENSPLPKLNNKNQGNLVLAAHDKGYAPIFRELHKLKKYDEIYIYIGGNTYIYEVVNQKVVQPSQVDIMNNVEDKSIITLFTCTTDGKKRIVVTGKLDEKKEGISLMRKDIKPIRNWNE